MAIRPYIFTTETRFLYPHRQPPNPQKPGFLFAINSRGEWPFAPTYPPQKPGFWVVSGLAVGAEKPGFWLACHR